MTQETTRAVSRDEHPAGVSRDEMLALTPVLHAVEWQDRTLYFRGASAADMQRWRWAVSEATGEGELDAFVRSDALLVQLLQCNEHGKRIWKDGEEELKAILGLDASVVDAIASEIKRGCGLIPTDELKKNSDEKPGDGQSSESPSGQESETSMSGSEA